ncbi:UDP-2,4-diacetamido-2,4,6-trideoxy-beta-L-altropyranose hydrolase [Chitinimonas taiwanensis]|uniref:UDP-2,4-diacetamido-2,4, 6-trideoxy-beta-L-altropyranose hydrolase n=1 Tax=Chitinimonas taiwanensis TaxID=240412 RepID=UPI0035B38042
MKVLFRVDASLLIGTGHVMRCLTLADALSQRGASCTFALRQLPGSNLEQMGLGYRIWRLPASYPGEAPANKPESPIPAKADLTALMRCANKEAFDWIVLDHYGLGTDWEASSGSLAPRLAVIDDLLFRAHDADILLDQNLLEMVPNAYPTVPDGRVPKQLLGPMYSLLRPQFAQYRQLAEPSGKERLRIMLFFGGGAAGGEVLKVLPALLDLPVMIDVVIGGANPKLAEISRLLAIYSNARLHVDTHNMASLMHDADLYLGGGGTVTWERACLGLPGLVVALSDNQEAMSQAAARAGMQQYLGRASELAPDAWRAATTALLADPARLAAMRANAQKLTDGLGAVRVASTLFELR